MKGAKIRRKGGAYEWRVSSKREERVFGLVLILRVRELGFKVGHRDDNVTNKHKKKRVSSTTVIIGSNYYLLPNAIGTE